MNKQAFLQETYDSSFRDELEKISRESIYDEKYKDARREVKSKTKYDPAIGLLSGQAAGGYLGLKLSKRTKNPLLAGLAAGGSMLAGMTGGTAGGVAIQKARRDKLVKSMHNEGYKKLYFDNRRGANKNEMKEFSDAFNESVRKGGKPLTDKKHLTMQKEMMGH